MANYLYRRDFISIADSIEKRVKIENIYPDRLEKSESIAPDPENMGKYIMFPYKEYNVEVSKLNPKAWSEGQAPIKNLYNNIVIVKDTINIELTTASSLSDFLYLTNSEKAGGAPFVFDGYPSFNNRREVNFSSGDSFNQLWPGNETVCDVDIKTNGQFVMSDFGCPVFNNTVTLMEDDEGNVKKLNDKIKNSKDFSYIGICGIKDYKEFWRFMKDKESLVMGESYGIKKMLEANESYISSTSFNSKFDFLIASLMTIDPSSCPCIFFKEPRKVPIAVRTAEVITTFFCSLAIIY